MNISEGNAPASLTSPITNYSSSDDARQCMTFCNNTTTIWYPTKQHDNWTSPNWKHPTDTQMTLEWHDYQTTQNQTTRHDNQRHPTEQHSNNTMTKQYDNRMTRQPTMSSIRQPRDCQYGWPWKGWFWKHDCTAEYWKYIDFHDSYMFLKVLR